MAAGVEQQVECHCLRRAGGTEVIDLHDLTCKSDGESYYPEKESSYHLARNLHGELRLAAS